MFEGCIAMVRIPSARLRPQLPPEIEIVSDDERGPSCLLLFGEQSEGTAFVGGMPIPWGSRYHELMVAVPDVRCTRTGTAHLFVLGMVCDAWWAVWNGNAYYGFRKRLAPITWDGRRFAVSGDGDRDGFRAVVDQATAAAPPIGWIQAAAALPVLGHRFDGRLVRSHFDWELGSHPVDPVTIRLAVSPAFAELPVGIDAAPSYDAIRISGMRWRLSWPLAAM
jgi:hypothetical protein